MVGAESDKHAWGGKCGEPLESPKPCPEVNVGLSHFFQVWFSPESCE